MNLPADFVTYTQKILKEDWSCFESALNAPPTISIRINTAKTDALEKMEKIPWCSSGHYLNERPSFTFDPLFHAGLYYVQEASSMFLEQAVKKFIKEDAVGLDLCAAPGGKSTLLLSLLSKNSFLISNEYIRNRAYILNENITKWGLPNQMVTNNSSEDFRYLENFFDFVLADVPCSGEGMFRKDSKAIEEWSLSNVNNCVLRQKEIISNIWDTIKPGGYLFYSTCTYNKEENEGIIEYIKEVYDATILSLDIREEWGISTVKIGEGEGYHFYPHKVKGEGLFFIAIRKNGENEVLLQKAYSKDKKKKLKEQAYKDFHLEKYLTNPDLYTILEKDNEYFALPKCNEAIYEFLKNKLNIISLGINMGTIKGKNFIPSQSLAMSTEIEKNEFATYNLNWNEALSFLRCEAITLNDAPKGIVLLKYKGYNLGFVKNIGNRANNLYPNEWRIRSAKNPETEISVL